MSRGTDVLVDRRDGVMVLTLNRPSQHNAISGTMMRDLAEAFDEAAADDAVRVVVTTGAGDMFCVGADAADLADMAGMQARELLSSDRVGGDKGLPVLTEDQAALDELGNAGRWTLRMWQLGKPTIAAINGSAVGGGFGIALLHDILLSSRSARMGPGFAPLGLAPELGISTLLPRAIGLSASAELLFSGRLLRAEEALRLGLLADVVDDGEVLDRALELAARIAAKPPLGVQSSKRLLRRSVHNDLESQLREEYHAQVVLFDHPETRQALGHLQERLKGAGTPTTGTGSPT